MLKPIPSAAHNVHSPLVAVTQRVEIIKRPGGGVERRDALDQAWTMFLQAAGCMPAPIPNDPDVAVEMLRELPVDALVLTGGNDLVAYGGDAPERDATEFALLAKAREWQLPVIGVCRGMQMIQQMFGVALERVEGHVADKQTISIDGRSAEVNSFHKWGASGTAPSLEVWARAGDGVVKGVRHRSELITGIMWHPERTRPFAARDLVLFQKLLQSDAGAL